MNTECDDAGSPTATKVEETVAAPVPGSKLMKYGGREHTLTDDAAGDGPAAGLRADGHVVTEVQSQSVHDLHAQGDLAGSSRRAAAADRGLDRAVVAEELTLHRRAVDNQSPPVRQPRRCPPTPGRRLDARYGADLFECGLDVDVPPASGGGNTTALHVAPASSR